MVKTCSEPQLAFLDANKIPNLTENRKQVEAFARLALSEHEWKINSQYRVGRPRAEFLALME